MPQAHCPTCTCTAATFGVIGAETAALIMQPNAEGYEVRAYQLPARAAAGYIDPISDLTPLWTAQYDHAGVAVRVAANPA